MRSLGDIASVHILDFKVLFKTYRHNIFDALVEYVAAAGLSLSLTESVISS